MERSVSSDKTTSQQKSSETMKETHLVRIWMAGMCGFHSSKARELTLSSKHSVSVCLIVSVLAVALQCMCDCVLLYTIIPNCSLGEDEIS